MRVCSFPGCGRKHKSRGLCISHHRQRTDGLPLVPIVGNTDRSSKSAITSRFLTKVNITSTSSTAARADAEATSKSQRRCANSERPAQPHQPRPGRLSVRGPMRQRQGKPLCDLPRTDHPPHRRGDHRPGRTARRRHPRRRSHFGLVP